MKSGTIHIGVAHGVAKLLYDNKTGSPPNRTSTSSSSTVSSVSASSVGSEAENMIVKPPTSVAVADAAVEITTTSPSTPVNASVATMAIATQSSTIVTPTVSPVSVRVDSKTFDTSPTATTPTGAPLSIPIVTLGTLSSKPATVLTTSSAAVAIVKTSAQDKSCQQEQPILQPDNNNLAASIEGKNRETKLSSKTAKEMAEIKSDTPKQTSEIKTQQGSNLPVEPFSDLNDGEIEILKSTTECGPTSGLLKKVKPKPKSAKNKSTNVRSTVLKDQGQITSDDVKEVKARAEIVDHTKSFIVASSGEWKGSDENQSSNESKSNDVKRRTTTRSKNLPIDQSSKQKMEVKEGRQLIIKVTVFPK